MARKRRTKAEILAAESKGLGDTVEKALEVTGIAKVAKWLLGEDCGCEERKAKLNNLFRYRKPLCLEQSEFEWLNDWFKVNRNTVNPSEQGMILKIHSRIFQVRNEPTSCGSCLLERVEELKTVYNTYKDEQNANTNTES
jgi:hypothetical protein